MKKTNSGKTNKINRKSILSFAKEQYKTDPEYPWLSLPDYAVLRHSENKKWYGIIMNVPRKKLGLPGKGSVDILEIKCDPILSGSVMSEKGILPAYHMRKGNWITVLLDGSADEELVFSLLRMSFDLTAANCGKGGKSGTLTVNREWIVPANPKYYDLEKAFSESDTILWKQSSNVIPGDIIYLYVAAPVSAVLYKCRAIETDIPYEYDDGTIRMKRVMKIKLIHSFKKDELGFDKLKEYGICPIRGPRNVPNSLNCFISQLCGKQ